MGEAILYGQLDMEFEAILTDFMAHSPFYYVVQVRGIPVILLPDPYVYCLLEDE